MNREYETTHELEERLVDQALREVVGGESPTDLTDRILAATRQGSVELKKQPANQLWLSWLVGLAALLVLSAILWPTIAERSRNVRTSGLSPAREQPSTSWVDAASKVDSVVDREESGVVSGAGGSTSDDLGIIGLDAGPAKKRQLQNFYSSVDGVERKPLVPNLNPPAPEDAPFVAPSRPLTNGSSGEAGQRAASPSDVDFYFRGYNEVPRAKPTVVERSKRATTRLSSLDKGSEIRELRRSMFVHPEARPDALRAKKFGSSSITSNRYENARDQTRSDIEIRYSEAVAKMRLAEQNADGQRRFDAKQLKEQFEKDPEYFSIAKQVEEINRYISKLSNVGRVGHNNREIEQLQVQAEKLNQEMAERVRELTPRIKLRLLGENPGTDRYEPIYENSFIASKGYDAVSTFSIDVDTAAYSNMRQFLNSGQMPPPNAIRLEELINYFSYDYAGPAENAKHPFASHVEVASCPWNADHRLVRVGIKGRTVEADKRPRSNIVFLLDVSGSMSDANKLPLVVDGLSHMTYQLGENDNVAIVVYAGASGMVLESTRGDKKGAILDALNRLSAGGSTAGGAGINLAYKTATENFIKGGVNRVILCTDGDFNVGTTDTDSLKELATQQAKETGVFLTVLGYGRGNLNDEMMESISNCGNGNYFYIDNLREARRVMVEQLSGTLTTIAKDVKIQVEFNPANVASHRLLGYENRMLERQDFDDDTKDAGEIGAGHTVTALYEIVPAGVAAKRSADQPLKYQPEQPLKYQPKSEQEEAEENAKSNDDVVAGEEAQYGGELLTLRLRYKLPDEDVSTKIEVAVKDAPKAFADASEDFRFASSVAGFGMLLRNSQHKGDSTFESVREMAMGSIGKDPQGYRAELVDLIGKAKQLAE